MWPFKRKDPRIRNVERLCGDLQLLTMLLCQLERDSLMASNWPDIKKLISILDKRHDELVSLLAERKKHDR